MNNQPIGIFDSGVGGLSILLAIQKILPKEHFIYLADQENCPYGEKTRAEVRRLSFKNTQFLLNKRCKVIIIACNTATVSAIDLLRKHFPKTSFIGVEPGVKLGVRLSKTGHIVVLSTPVTQKSQRLGNLIKKFSKGKKVYNLGCPGLVDLIEKGEIKNPKVVRLLKKSLGRALKDPLVDVLVLGCTHYFFVKELILELFPKKMKIITTAEPVAKQVKRVLKAESLLTDYTSRDACIISLDYKEKKDQFFTSGNVVAFNQVVNKLTGLLIGGDKI